MSKKQTKKQDLVTSTVATDKSGTIQITFTIPQSIISANRSHALNKLAKDMDIPGFRKGNAPASEVEKHLGMDKIIEQTLSLILPDAFSKVISENKLKPAVYPKFEVVSATKEEPWQVRAITCNVPDVDITAYKEKVVGEARSKKIWTPDKKDEKSTSTKAEKEQAILEVLSNWDVELPQLLIREEANNRLSRLLERIEKLGISLEDYLKSIGKTSDSIREEYEKQAESSIKVELILNRIAEDQNIEVDTKDIDQAISASFPGQEDKIKKDSSQVVIIKSILMRRAALDSLASLL